MSCWRKVHLMDDRQRTLELIRANAVNHAHFFDGLNDAGWLDFLAREGFFKDPPPPEVGEDWVRFPHWPESAYLARIAAAEPERIGRIAAEIPTTDNVRVMTDLTLIAAVLPVRQAAGFARRLREWIGDHRILLALPEAAPQLVSHLARLGDLDAALELALELLWIEGEERAGALAPRTEPVGRIDRWEYERMLGEIVPTLLTADRDRALSFLGDLLARAVNLEAGEDGGDYTYILRPSIADHAQNHDDGLVDLLISAMRDASIEAAGNGEGTQAVLATLRAREQDVFARIALHVITEIGSPEEAFAALTDPEAGDAISAWHEYSELLARRFGELDEEQREVVLRFLAVDEDGPVDDETNGEAESRRRWRFLQRLAMIASELEGIWAETYRGLLEEFDEPEHPSFLSYMKTFTGPTSPLGVEELRQLGPQGALNALAGWEPAGGFEDPTPEGLSRVLEEVVKAEPRPYAEIAMRFRTLEPTYVRGLLNGLWSALKEGITFPWSAVLELSAWVVAQPHEAEELRADDDRDPGWSWSRKAIADLLTSALEEGSAEAPIEMREEIFGLLAVLTEDPNPTPEHEERYGGSNMDPATLALNTTRGEAMNALIRYSLWVTRHAVEKNAGLSAVPEARELIERHLDPGIDPSLAVRSVYGRWFAQLLNLDRDWTTAATPRIFPGDAESPELFAAAFDSFLAFSRPWPPAFELLGPVYRVAAERAGEEPRSRTLHGDPRRRLGDHLTALRAYGTIDLEPGDLLDVFWSNATAEVRGTVVRNAGWTIERTENPDPQVFARLVETWEWIAERENGEDAPQVLGNFGAWLAASTLDPAWLLQQALVVLGRGIPLDPEFSVFQALPRLAETDPRSALAVLSGILETGSEHWAPFGSREEIRELLELTLASPSMEIRKEASHIIDRLIGLGLQDFRDLADLGRVEPD
jgi:hypothetical protein